VDLITLARNWICGFLTWKRIRNLRASTEVIGKWSFQRCEGHAWPSSVVPLEAFDLGK
jgi:hypothetical protein